MRVQQKEPYNEYLRQAVPFFTTQGAFLDAARKVWAEQKLTRPGRQSQQDKFFRIIANHLRKSSNNTQGKTIKALMEKAPGLKETTARRYVKLYLLMELRSFGNLKPAEKKWLEKNNPTFWERNLWLDKKIREVRSLERDIAARMLRRAAMRVDSALNICTSAGKSLSTAPLLTKQEIFEMVGL